MGFFSRIASLFARPKKLTLGLALGSGGAKGTAHLGVLKAFEEAGLDFQIVTGTSIGSIVGALYCAGYSWKDTVEIVRNLNVKEFAGNLRPFADMQFAESYLSRYLEGEFSDLKKPFAAWATDTANNQGVLLNGGNLPRALTASSAIPPFFRAVEIDGKRLADGAYTNAIPADVCRQMGADFVIGCDLSAYTKPEEEKSTLSRVLGNAIKSITSVRYAEDSKSRGYAASDIMLRPNLIDYRATDVTRAAMERMFELGYEEATSRLPEIREKLKEASVARRKEGKKA